MSDTCTYHVYWNTGSNILSFVVTVRALQDTMDLLIENHSNITPTGHMYLISDYSILERMPDITNMFDIYVRYSIAMTIHNSYIIHPLDTA